jgi:N-acetylglucosaminyl-diphospho-decaprenol L-rhamnosyltransferase
MSQVDLSIVIVSFNVRDLLEQCIASVARLEADRFIFETIVVDNASSDDSAEMVRKNFPQVRLLVNNYNRGFAAANNRGFADSTGRYVLMLNPDTCVREGSLETLVTFMESRPLAGVCGGKLLYPDGSLQHSAFRFPTLAQILLDFFPLNRRLTDSRLNGRYPSALYAHGEPFRVDHPLGADFMARRLAADQVGWLDDRFFIYCEEIDWAIRFKRAGWETWCVPKAEIVHHEAQSTRQFRDRSFVNLWRARLQLFSKHYSRGFQFAANRLVRLGLWASVRQARREALKGLVTQDELEQRIAAYRAVREMI